MATIKLKSSTGTRTVPSSLAQGEMAINVADGNLFYGDNSSNVNNDFRFAQVGVTGLTSGATTHATTLSGGSGGVYGTLQTAAQANITTVGTVETGTWASNIKFELSDSGVNGDGEGDITFIGSEVATTAGALYYYNGTTWVSTDSSAVSTSTGLVAVALGTSNTESGMLLRGMVTTAAAPGGSDGNVIYISETAGKLTTTAPTTSGAIVRAVGYALDTSEKQIWFNPDNTWVELS